MSSSTYYQARIDLSKDKEFLSHIKVYKACEEAEVEIPSATKKFFKTRDIDPETADTVSMLVELIVTCESDEGLDRVIIPLKQLPANTKEIVIDIRY